MTNEFSRRRMVQLSGAVAVAALAGCNESQSTDGTTGTPADATDAGGETTAETAATETAATETVEPGAETETPDVAETETAATETAETETAETETATDETVTPHGDLHAHGSLVVEINGETYTLADKSWNYEKNTGEPNFHFHPDNDDYHLHADGVTLDYALDSLPKADATPETFVFRGHEYDATEPGTSVSYVAGGEDVNLDYVLPASGPDLRVVVETADPTPTPVSTTSG